ncbi:Sensor protein of zinc sigma-54-dependent two-component system [Minicystis rosea]|nr:Sensor protein of zinc sigma-54-dependent two-component system [Minicystis rosea]
MALSVAAVTGLAFWDKQREAAVVLQELADDQATLAGSVASELETRLAAIRRDGLVLAESLEDGRRTPATAIDGYAGYTLRAADDPPSPPLGASLVFRLPASHNRVLDLQVPPAKLFEEAARIERPGFSRLLVRGPDDRDLRTTDGRVVKLDPVQRGLDSGRRSAWLTAAEAITLGLPSRRAAVGLDIVDAGPFGRWSIAVVTTAERVRSREEHATWRLVLGVLVVGGLVFVFGTLALRRQRRGLLLERELALQAVARERDGELATASRAATLGTLAMGIAHEVSTPLGIIAGRAEQLTARVEGDPRADRAVQAILEQTDRIRRTIRGFLDLVRGAAPALGDTTPAAVLAGAIALVEHRFTAAGVALDTDVPASLPVLHGDAPMLQQAIVNLLLNACDACVRGGHVQAAARVEGDHIAFTVIDDGAGITAEAAARALEPFFTTKAQGQGTGLGLAITSEIVKLHRGTLSLRPASPRGTCASLLIPVPKVQSHAAA